MVKEVTLNFNELVENVNSKKNPQQKIEQVFNNESWSLYDKNAKLQPLVFSNGKTQEDIVNEVVSEIKKGTKVVFIHGVCGTGKSAIALNIARKFEKASIVVPIKSLQKQYEEDYMGSKFLLKSNGKKMKIATITGRDNHASIVKQDANCADPFLPDTIKITEKNMPILQDYYRNNPLIIGKDMPPLKELKRISIAPANPHWSPILPAQIEVNLPDAKKKRYKGLENKEFIFYHRKEGCSYYDQYQAYIDADVILFNAAKYKIENTLNRKPATEVEIIDEADEFLDNLSNQQTLNLTKLSTALNFIHSSNEKIQENIEKIQNLIRLEEKDKGPLAINEKNLFKLVDTKLDRVLSLLLRSQDLEDELHMDEQNYVSQAMEAAKSFEDFRDETYVTFRRQDKEVLANIVTINVSKRFKEIADKNKAIVLMSGTLHDPQVLKEVYGITTPVIIEAETASPGAIEIVKTGLEFDCRYSNFGEGKHTREEYLKALDSSIAKAKRPTLVHVNAYDDLPTENEKVQFNLKNTLSKEKLLELQDKDKTGMSVSLFKRGLTDILFSTKCARGVDFPGETCNSMVFTKYPNPNPQETFWRLIQMSMPAQFWPLYKDKAQREFLQRLYRALRSKDDHVQVLSPDTRVLDAARELQNQK
jgi:Rad3-related DNA helicase